MGGDFLLAYAIEVYMQGILQGYIYDINDLTYVFRLTGDLSESMEWGYRAGLDMIEDLHEAWGSCGYDFVLLRL